MRRNESILRLSSIPLGIVMARNLSLYSDRQSMESCRLRHFTEEQKNTIAEDLYKILASRERKGVLAEQVSQSILAKKCRSILGIAISCIIKMVIHRYIIIQSDDCQRCWAPLQREERTVHPSFRSIGSEDTSINILFVW